MMVSSVAGVVPSKRITGHRRSKGLFVAIALVAALSGCKAFVKEDPPPCPRVSILAETASITRMSPTNPSEVALQAKITSYKGYCSYETETHVMTVNVALDIDATRGPGMSDDKAVLPYFVAVPAYFGDPKGKQVMPITLRFPPGVPHIHYVDEPVYVRFPVEALAGTEVTPGVTIKDIAKYEVFFGWQLEPNELAYNRKQSGAP